MKLNATMLRVGAAGVVATAFCVAVSAASVGATPTTAPIRVKPKFTAQKLREDSNPGGVVEGPDGNLWATEEYGGVIDRVTPSGQLTAYQLQA